MPPDVLNNLSPDDIARGRVDVARSAAAQLKRWHWHWPADDCLSYANEAASELPDAAFIACGTTAEPDLIKTVIRRAETIGKRERQERRTMKPVLTGDIEVLDRAESPADAVEQTDLLEAVAAVVEVAIDEESTHRNLPRDTIAAVWQMSQQEELALREIEADTGVSRSTAGRIVSSIRHRVARHFDWYRELNTQGGDPESPPDSGTSLREVSPSESPASQSDAPH